ncbi:MAG: YlbF family regulator [Lachnospiraceae bacterium]|nr:YlbF family regulator [Lachnospiraceae bacterium]
MEAGVEAALKQLNDAILNSEVYKRYCEQQARVNEQPELKRRINEYRKKNFELQNTNSTLDKIEEFEREFEGFRDDELVNDYLAAELAFCRMMQRIDVQLIAGIDFE